MSASINVSILIGRLTKEPTLRTAGDKQVATFTIAVSREYDREKADFIPVQVWGKMAGNCEKYLTKGSLVAVEGSIQTRSWEKNGAKHYTTEVVAHKVRFLDKKKDANNDDAFDGFTPVEDDGEDLPF